MRTDHSADGGEDRAPFTQSTGWLGWLCPILPMEGRPLVPVTLSPDGRPDPHTCAPCASLTHGGRPLVPVPRSPEGGANPRPRAPLT